jgi:SH3-like domain-containing protein
VPAFVNLRQEPSMEAKIIRVLKKGTKLTVLKEKPGWLRVRLEDGAEGWVGKAMTSEGA